MRAVSLKTWLGGDEARRPSFLLFFLLAAYAIAATVYALAVHNKAHPAVALVQPQSSSPSRIPGLRLTYWPSVFRNDAIPNSTYAGPPTPERDDAWRRFMLPTGLRVSRDELRRDHQTSVPLPEGGFLGRLGVYHEIHCLAFLRQWNYRSHYYPGMDSLGLEAGTSHADHCIELLRQAAVCRADTSISTFRWSEGTETPQFDAASPAVHMCVDWKALLASLESRVVPHAEMERLVRPS